MDETSKIQKWINGVITKEYRAWKAMKARCTAPSYDTGYNKYQQKGMTVCERWTNSFEAFIEDMGNAPSEKHSLDRINNDLGYFPENCRWETQKVQCSNRGSFNRVITYQDKTMVLKDWARELNLEYSGLRKRIFDKGMSFEEAIDKSKIYKLVEYLGMQKTLKEWSDYLGIPISNLYDRKSKGWTVERMFTTPINMKI